MMRFLRTDFSKVHAAVASAALITVILGSLMFFGVLPYVPFGVVHGIFGIAIFALLLLLPMVLKGRSKIYRAFWARISLRRKGSAGNPLFALLARITTLLMALLFVLQLVTGLLMMTGLTYQWFPTFGMLSFHTTFLYILGILILLHIAFMLLAKAKTTTTRKT
jgi:hypothetical protein